MQEALDILTKKIAKVISNLSAFALKWKGKSISSFYYIPFMQKRHGSY